MREEPKLDNSGNAVLRIVPNSEPVCPTDRFGKNDWSNYPDGDTIEEAADKYCKNKLVPNTKGMDAEVEVFEAYVDGWKANPATWTETEVHQLLSKVIYDVTQKQFTMEGCSVSGHRAKILMNEFKKQNDANRS